MIDRRLMIAALLCALLGLAACSGGNDQASLPPQHGAEATLQLDGLELLEGSLLDTAASRGISVEWSEDGGRPLAMIHAEDVRNLRALYFSLEHRAGLQATAIEAGDWAAAGSLELALTPASGHSEAGIVLLDPDNTPGFSGSGLLATVHFDNAAGPDRGSSQAPLSEAARTELSSFSEFFSMYWLYRNPGDYDQNGEVNISDLTPLAVHFGENANGAAFSQGSIQSVVDGDGNGEINISDISPIGANYGNSVTQYDVHVGGTGDYPQTPGELSGIPAIESITLDMASGSPAGQRLSFSFGLQFALPASSGAWVRPVSGTSEGIASNAVGFGNKAPEVVLNLNSPVGVTPFTLQADASLSTDADGDELSYSWLFGDELTIFLSGSLLTFENQGPTFAEDALAGNYFLGLFVRDSRGAVSFLSESIIVTENPGWQLLDTDLDGYHGNFQKFADVDICEAAGRPTIAYSFEVQGGQQCYFTWSNQLFSASNWDVGNIVHAQSNVTGSEVAVAEVNGRAAVATTFMRPSGGEAVYAGQIEPGEPELYNQQVFETPGGGLSGVDLQEINDQAMVIYRNNATGEVRTAFALDDSAQNWIGPVSIGITGAPSSPISLAEIGGAPAFVYWAGPSSNRLRIHRSVMNLQIPVYDNGLTLSVLTSCNVQDGLLILDDGRPAVIFSIPAQAALYIMRAIDPQASGWEAPEQITPAGALPTEYSTAIHAGRPAVAWYDVLEAELYYMRATDAAGTAWAEPELIDDALATGTRPAMAEVRGVPVIAYIDQGRNKLRYGIRVE